MTVKASWLFNGTNTNGQLVWGFSESWYSNNSGDQLIAQMRTLARTRIQFCASGTVLYGYRIGQPSGKSITVREFSSIRAPRNNDAANVPQDAALCVCRGAAATAPKKEFWMHCLPDDYVNDGAFANVNFMGQSAAAWVQGLLDAGFQFRYSQYGTPARIASISDAGAVVLSDNLVLAAGTNVKLIRVRDVNARGVKGIYTIAATPAPTATTFTLLNWPGKTVGVSGKIATITYGYSNIVAPDPKPGTVASVLVRPGVRKCGRPFGQLVGRVSARR